MYETAYVSLPKASSPPNLSIINQQRPLPIENNHFSNLIILRRSFFKMETPQSFTARRSAASHLPTFQLPPPDLSNMHKYPPFASANNSNPSPISIGHVLTPPASLPNEGLSPISSSVTSGSSGSSAGGIPPYNPNNNGNYWTTQSGSYAFSAPPQMPAPYASQNPIYSMGRQLYSPSSNYPARTSGSPTTGENLPPPPYDLNLPPFSTSISQSSGPQSNLPMLAPHQQQQQMQNALMNSQQPASQAPSQNTVHAPENYGGRPPPTPTYSSYAPTSTPQQSTFPAYAQNSPPRHSPVSAPPRMSQVPQNTSSMGVPYQQRPYNGYSLPAMSGPVMSNVHSPGGQMALVGGMNMGGYPGHSMGQHMYPHPGQQQQQNDRPFKCDQCPQSFNRNHDLKRHKRIHLAVKPFPCGHCEKSFSRKDALKVRLLAHQCRILAATSLF